MSDFSEGAARTLRNLAAFIDAGNFQLRGDAIEAANTMIVNLRTLNQGLESGQVVLDLASELEYSNPHDMAEALGRMHTGIQKIEDAEVVDEDS